MKCQTSKKGFTLVELMIAIAIVAILVAVAIPSYSKYVRKANRGEAQQLLMNWSNNQEIWRASHTSYASDAEIAPPTHAKFDFSIADISATTFTLTADPKGDQTKDKDKGVDCDPLTLNQSNAKTPTQCW